MKILFLNNAWRAKLALVACITVLLFYSGAVTAQSDASSVIEVNQDATDDSDIENRIAQILSKIDGLGSVTVQVESGVVTLQGDAANEQMAQSALQIAERTVGVVQVVDEVNRTLAVADNVEPLLSDLKDKLQNFVRALPLTLLALGIFIVFVVLAALVARWRWLWRKIAPNPFLAELLSQAVRVAIIAVGVVLALNLVGASRFVATILGGAGVAGIAIGFAVRDTLENYISSIMLSLRQPFRAEDHVVINDLEGYVVRLTSRATILMTLDGNHLRIPNSVVFKGVILNYTTNPERRFSFQLGVDANDDPLEAMSVALDAVNSNTFVLDDPATGASIVEVGDSSIILRFTGWVDQSKHSFLKVRSAAIKSAITALEDQGFTLPEPIYRLRFDGIPASLSVSSDDSDKANDGVMPTHKPKPAKIPLKPAEPDVSVDNDIKDKVVEERVRDADDDLLDHSLPTE